MLAGNYERYKKYTNFFLCTLWHPLALPPWAQFGPRWGQNGANLGPRRVKLGQVEGSWCHVGAKLVQDRPSWLQEGLPLSQKHLQKQTPGASSSGHTMQSHTTVHKHAPQLLIRSDHPLISLWCFVHKYSKFLLVAMLTRHALNIDLL